MNATRENLVPQLQLHGKPCAEEVGGIFVMSKYTIGIDLGGTTMTAGLVNESLRSLAR